MSEPTVNLYEGMFLFDLTQIGSDLSTAVETVNEILSRADAEIISVAKWDERRLAYEIKSQKRGLYIIAYFRVRGTQIANIERDVNLSEKLLRCMMVRAEDYMGEVELDAAKQAARETNDAIALTAAGESKDVSDASDAEPAEPAETEDSDSGADDDSDAETETDAEATEDEQEEAKTEA